MGLAYKYSLDVVSIFLMLFLFIYLRGKRKANIFIYKLYNWLVIDTFLAASFDIILGEALNNLELYGDRFALVMKLLYLTLQISLTVLFSLYILSLAGINIVYEKAWKHILLIPAIIATALMYVGIIKEYIAVGMSTDFFYMESITAGILIFSGIYIFLWAIILFKYNKAISQERKVYIRVFIVVHLFSLMTYVISNFAGTFTFELSLAMIVLIYAVQSPDEYFDKSDAMHFKYLKDTIKLELSRERAFSLIYVRLQDADVIYDSFGEINANKLLTQVTAYLLSVDKSAMVYRENRNTFVVKMNRVDDTLFYVIRRNIINRFQREFKFGDLSAIFSVGLVSVVAPEDIKTIEKFDEISSLVKYAIIPVGSDYSYTNLIENDKETEVIEAVKRAVENNGFQVFYQPIYSTHKKKIVAAEALIRLFDDKIGFVSPEIFIPLAEREGYILSIGEFVFTEVCRYYSENKLNEKGIEYIEVNLSAVQCMQYKLADEFVAIMHKYGVSSSQINFEITETSAMQTNNAVQMNIHYFLDHGVDLSLDDYGTGYSNISYLYHLPFAFMKIDKSILWSSDKNDKANITLTNIFKMAKNLKMRIVVEGVETEEHIKKLLDLDCDYFQGYYFSKPINGDAFLKYVEEFTIPEICRGA